MITELEFEGGFTFPSSKILRLEELLRKLIKNYNIYVSSIIVSTQHHRRVRTLTEMRRILKFKHHLYLSNHLFLPDSSLIYFIAVMIRQGEIVVLLHCQRLFQTLSVKAFALPKGQTSETEIELWEFFDDAMLESIQILQTSKLACSVTYFNMIGMQKKWML